MTKQDEIRDGMEEILKDTGHFFPYASATKELLNFLVSEGCVLKVEGELPANPFVIKNPRKSDPMKWTQHFAANNGFATMLKAGYTAWEPLA